MSATKHTFMFWALTILDLKVDSTVKGTLKVIWFLCLRTGYGGLYGEMEVEHFTFLNMDLDTGEWTPSPSDCYTSGEKALAI